MTYIGRLLMNIKNFLVTTTLFTMSFMDRSSFSYYAGAGLFGDGGDNFSYEISLCGEPYVFKHPHCL